jgi:hypothetical protein
MVKSGVFEKVKLSKLPSDVKIIDTTWAMKKKSNGTLCERINICGFNSLTAIGPYMAHRFFLASFKANNFSNFCSLAMFDSSKCS